MDAPIQYSTLVKGKFVQEEPAGGEGADMVYWVESLIQSPDQ